MPFSKDDLLKLKGKVETKEELKELARKENINYTEEELTEAYNSLKNVELDLDDLNEVSGGFNTVVIEADKTLQEVKCKCGNIFFIAKDGKGHNCPVCGRLHRAKKTTKEKSFFNWC